MNGFIHPHAVFPGTTPLAAICTAGWRDRLGMALKP